MKKFNQLATITFTSDMNEQIVQVHSHYYEYLYNVNNENTKSVDLNLVETYSPFQFSFDDCKSKCFLTDVKGVFPYNYIKTENEWLIYKEDKPGFCGYRLLYFSANYSNLQWDCPEDYVPKAEKKSVRILHWIETD